jgi:hypothetical protein
VSAPANITQNQLYHLPDLVLALNGGLISKQPGVDGHAIGPSSQSQSEIRFKLASYIPRNVGEDNRGVRLLEGPQSSQFWSKINVNHLLGFLPGKKAQFPPLAFRYHPGEETRGLQLLHQPSPPVPARSSRLKSKRSGFTATLPVHWTQPASSSSTITTFLSPARRHSSPRSQ